MKNIIEQNDIEKAQKILEEIEEDLNKLIAFEKLIKEISTKSKEEITEEDVELYGKFSYDCLNLGVKIDTISYISRKFEAAITELNTMKENYPLVDESDYLSPEEKKNLETTEEIVNEYNKQKERFESINRYFDIEEKINKKHEEKFIKEKIADIKDDLLEPQDDSSCLIMAYGNKTRVVSSKEASLIKDGKLPRPVYAKYEDYGPHGDYTRTVYYSYSIDSISFIPYSEATLEQKQQIRTKENRLKEIMESKNPKYSKNGIALIPLTEAPVSPYDRSIRKIPIETTPKDFAKAGLLYDEYEFKPSRKISNKEIATACNSYALTTEETKGIKGFIISKLKEFFKGIGEK